MAFISAQGARASLRVMVSVIPAATAAKPQPTEESWRLDGGDEIVPGRHALTLLGGGERYEAYLAWDDRLHATVVAKMLRPHLVGHPRSVRSMHAEAEALVALEHPALVRSFGVHLDGARPHLILEHLDGPRLSTLLRRSGPLAAEQIVPLARQLCSALVFIHLVGWVHLDVKPRNIIMTASPRLIDLSIARTIEAARQVHDPIGTDAYMSPEQCDPDGFAHIGPASDVWGIGATLYEALTGRRAFSSSARDSHPQLRQAAPPLSAKAPPVLAEAIRSCLEVDPSRRPTASELDDALQPLDEWSARAARRLR